MSYAELQNPPTEPVDETDTTLGEIDLSTIDLPVNQWSFRFRRVDVGVGGVVPFHSHERRPALLYIMQGEITEYSTAASGPVVRRAGETIPEFGAVSHWWRNTGDTPVVILAADLAEPSECVNGEC
ncbi:MAG: cupin domain-containing protein [Pseudomonadota bacterium]